MKKYRGSLWIGMMICLLSLHAPGADKVQAADNDIDLSGFPNVQGQFEDLTKELGLALSYLPMSPAEPLGITGFDVGVEGTFAKIKSD
ncbi:MAG: hypothetical protein HY760_07255, partial [Nitrospirae bacterium]|nr:hypothetical protein [Nitrospirota bacterium]